MPGKEHCVLCCVLYFCVCVRVARWLLTIYNCTFAGVGRFVSEKLRNASYTPVETLEVNLPPLSTIICYTVHISFVALRSVAIFI